MQVYIDLEINRKVYIDHIDPTKNVLETVPLSIRGSLVGSLYRGSVSMIDWLSVQQTSVSDPVAQNIFVELMFMKHGWSCTFLRGASLPFFKSGLGPANSGVRRR